MTSRLVRFGIQSDRATVRQGESSPWFHVLVPVAGVTLSPEPATQSSVPRESFESPESSSSAVHVAADPSPVW